MVSCLRLNEKHKASYGYHLVSNLVLSWHRALIDFCVAEGNNVTITSDAIYDRWDGVAWLTIY